MMDDRQDLLVKLQSQKDVWQAQLAQLQVQADTQDEQNREAYYNMIDNLQKMLENFNEKFDQLKNSVEEKKAWDDHKKEMEELLKSINDAFGTVTARFKSELS
jgi:predicted RNase H-like nuclease (RuvC/YqgF family)